MKLVSIVGARPQFIKIAPLLRSFEQYSDLGGEPIENIIVHTGQHYDAGMSDVFFDQLEIPPPRVNLGVGSGCHGSQTGQMLERIEKVLLETSPDMVVVYGDTNSTLAGALAAVKVHIPVAHVEAGPRSFNRQMPEEINRIVADHVSDLLLAPTAATMENLRKEGLSDKAVLSGDIMYDAVLTYMKLSERHSTILEHLGLTQGRYGLVTLHRAENTDDEEKLHSLLTTFNDIAARVMRLVFPMHPRTAKRLQSGCGKWSAHPRLHLIEPVGYLDMLGLVRNAQVTLTDSGGLQKEAFFLGCPCITLRDETEWLETIHEGGNILAGFEPARIFAALSNWETRSVAGKTDFSANAAGSFGGGHAAERIKDALVAFHQQSQKKSKKKHQTSLDSTLEEVAKSNY